MSKVKIPATIEEATKSLGGLGALLTAKEWERAAIVYAFTDPVVGNQASRSTGLSIEQFAKLGISGLKSDRTVREYRKAWQWAIDNGMAVVVEPGSIVSLPTHGWPPIDHQRGSHATKEEVITGFRKMVEEDPKAAVRELIQDSPTTVPKLAKGVRTAHPGLAALASSPSLDEAAAEPRVVLPREEDGPDYSDDLRSAVNRLQRVLAAARDGRWEPDAMEKTLIAFLASAFNELATGDVSSSVIDEIEQFLSQEAQR